MIGADSVWWACVCVGVLLSKAATLRSRAIGRSMMLGALHSDAEVAAPPITWAVYVCCSDKRALQRQTALDLARVRRGQGGEVPPAVRGELSSRTSRWLHLRAGGRCPAQPHHWPQREGPAVPDEV